MKPSIFSIIFIESDILPLFPSVRPITQFRITKIGQEPAKDPQVNKFDSLSQTLFEKEILNVCIAF